MPSLIANEKARGREKHAGMWILHMNSTTPRRRVKRKPARRITKADRDAIRLLYAPAESNKLDDDEYGEHPELPKTRNHKNHREGES